MNAWTQDLARHPDFRFLARPLEEGESLPAYAYALREDGTLVFFVAALNLEGEPVWIGDPVRLPDHHGYRGRASHETLFGMPYLNVMKIYEDGTVFSGQDIQQREIDAIVAHARGAIAPMRRCTIHSAARFGPHEFTHRFDFAAGLDWALERDPGLFRRALAWATRDLGLPREALGLTGGTLLGIEEEEDGDVDLVFTADHATLLAVREELRRGADAGRYRRIDQFGKVWHLRVWLDEETQLCPFFVLADPSEGPLWGADLCVLERRDTLEVRVADDRFNMVSPTVLKVEAPADRAHVDTLVITNTVNRGDFWEGDRLRIEHPLLVEIRPPGGAAYPAYLACDWNQIEVPGPSSCAP